MKLNKKKTIALTAAFMAVALMVAGCSKAASDTGVRSERNTAEAYTYETTAAEYDYDERAGLAMSTSNAMADVDYYEGEDIKSPEPGYNGDDSRTELNPETGRLLIRRVSISVETLNYQDLCNNVTARAKELGGYIETSQQGGTGNDRDLRTAYFVIRVPEDQLDTLINELGGQGNIVSRSETSDDVTLNYVDTKSKLEAYRIEQEQLLEMLDEAEDLDTIILLQNELTNVRYEIEYYESSLRMLENQVTYATLTLNVEEVIEETEIKEAHVVTFTERIKDAFDGAIEDTKTFFEEAVIGIVGAFPVICFFLVIAIIVVIVVVVNVKKAKKTRAKIKAAQTVDEGKAGEEKKAEDMKKD